MRAERLRAEALTLADDQHDDQSGDCGVDVDDRTTCEIVGGCADRLGNGAVGGQQAAVPHHVGERSVIERDPQRHENHPRGVLHTFGDGAADQRDGDHGERGLEGHVHADRVVVAVQCGRCEDALIGNHGVLQQEAGCRVAEDAADRGAGVGDRPTPQHPHDHRDGQCGRLHDHHIQHGLGADHATIEERHTRRHEEHKGRGSQYPRGISRIKLAHVTLLFLSLYLVQHFRPHRVGLTERYGTPAAF